MNRNRWAEADASLASARENILGTIEQATHDEWSAGLTWYADSQAWISDLADETDLSPQVVAGVVAALSPNNRWERNLEDARNVCLAVTADDAKDAFDAVSVATFNANKAKAWEILQGKGENSGPKTRAFARNLSGDLSAVTVDRHAFNVAAAGEWIVDKGGPKITPKRYEIVAQGYTDVAQLFGIEPAQAQAIAWITWKRLVGR